MKSKIFLDMPLNLFQDTYAIIDSLTGQTLLDYLTQLAGYSTAPQEIERRFTLKSIPTGLLSPCRYEQSYLRTDPEEIRIRAKFTDASESYSMTIKTHGGVKRAELDFELTTHQYGWLDSQVIVIPIVKLSGIYLGGNGEVSMSEVDRGHDWSYCYAEVEFPNEDAASAYIPDFEFLSEVTADPYYNMRNTWERTRFIQED